MNEQQEIERRFSNQEVWKRRKHRPGYVYIVGLTGMNFYKIGFSDSPLQRRDTIQRHNPHEVYIKHLIETDAMIELEKRLHRHYAKQRIRGEWFELSEDDLKHIESIDGAILDIEPFVRFCTECGQEFKTYYDMTTCGAPCTQQANLRRPRSESRFGLADTKKPLALTPDEENEQ